MALIHSKLSSHGVSLKEIGFVFLSGVLFNRSSVLFYCKLYLSIFLKQMKIYFRSYVIALDEVHVPVKRYHET